MKRTFIAALVAATFATPAGAVPAALADEMLSGVFTGLEEPLVIQREMLLAANEIRIDADSLVHDALHNMTTFYGPRMMGSRLVKGAPYSAEVVTETNQSLADGNAITHKTTGAIYRDGEGRTRQESGTDGKKKTAVYVNDPVAGKYIVLMPDSKTAVVRPRAAIAPMAFTHVHTGKEKQVMKFGATEVRIEDGKVFVDGKEVSDGKVELKTRTGKDVRIENGKVFIDGKDVVATAPRAEVRTIEDNGDGMRREEIRVQVVRSGDKEIILPIPPVPPVAPVPPVPPLPPLPGVQTLRFESTEKLGKGVTTQLGAKDFDGVRAEGKSTVWTIAAGEIGNRNPIMVTSESWYSPDLKVTVYSRYNDPRTGESIYRLANIRRAEPSPALFTVPEGYSERGRAKREERPERK